MPAPDGGNRPRASRNVRLVLMGVAGAALLYSCSPAIGTAVGGMPSFWLFGNPFYRGPNVAANCGPDSPGTPQCATGTSSSSSRTGTSTSSSFRGSTSSSGSSATTTGQGSGAAAGQTTSSRGGFGSSATSHGSSSSS